MVNQESNFLAKVEKHTHKSDFHGVDQADGIDTHYHFVSIH